MFTVVISKAEIDTSTARVDGKQPFKSLCERGILKLNTETLEQRHCQSLHENAAVGLDGKREPNTD